jgi:hypothetical protein
VGDVELLEAEDLCPAAGQVHAGSAAHGATADDDRIETVVHARVT